MGFLKIIIGVFLGSIALVGYSQTTEFTFINSGEPPCNPFPAYNMTDRWTPSHGSPSLGDHKGQGFKYHLLLRGQNVAGISKTEGIFIAYDFLANHKYDITVYAARPAGQVDVGLDIYAANNMVESSDAACGESPEPKVADKKVIRSILPVVLNAPNTWTNYTTKDFKPGSTTYKFLWLKSVQNFNQYNGYFYVERVVISDRGIDTAPEQPEPEELCAPETNRYALRLKNPYSEQGLAQFGKVVAASGDYFAVSAPGLDKVFMYKKTGCEFEMTQEITMAAESFAVFGASIDIDNNRMVIGLDREVEGGAAFVYELQNGVWNPLGSVTSTTPNFGGSVAIQGNSLVVGAPRPFYNLGYYKSGDVFMYEWTWPGYWNQRSSYSGVQPWGGFATSVDIVGDAVIVGEPIIRWEEDFAQIGTVHFFRREGSGTASTWAFEKRFSNEGWGYGHQVKLLANGQRAIVSVAIDTGGDGPQIHVFKKLNDVWNYQGNIGSDENKQDWWTFAADDTNLVVRFRANLSVYHLPTDVWYTHTNTFWPRPLTGRDRLNFGISMALGGDYLVVGDTEEACHSVGSVYIFDTPSLHEFPNLELCNKTYSGAQAPIFAETTVMANTGANCGNVIFNSGATATYHARTITLGPGFRAMEGSTVQLKITSGCKFGTGVPGMRLADEDEAVQYVLPEEQSALAEGLSVYPNPTTSGSFVVQAAEGTLGKIVVLNSQGVLVSTVQTEQPDGTSVQVYIPEHTKGIYLLRVMVNGKPVVKKLVKN